MKHVVRAASLLAVLAGQTLVSGQAPQAPSQPLPTFKAEVEYVEVDALVTDREGTFVRGLTKDDFQVFEDGKAQTITNFITVDLPIERAIRPLFAERPIEPDVQTNERPFDGRVYVLVLDDLHVAALRSQRVRQSVRRFIERNLAANDRMAIVSTGGRSQDAQEFTSNKRLLLAAVDKFMGQKLDSATVTRNNEYFRSLDAPTSGRVNDPEESQRAQQARSTLTTLQKVSEWFGGVRGRRKSLLFVSEGIDYDLSDIIRQMDGPQSQASGIIEEIRETIAKTARANVSIYSIDPRGLADGADDDITVTQFADSQDPSAGIGQRSLRNDILISQNSLRDLAEETGGFAIVNRNNVTDSFDRIVQDNSSYYVLAYYPPTDKRTGRFHKIDVKVTRPGLVVRARRGYVSTRNRPAPPKNTKATMPAELLDAVNSPLPVNGLAMHVFVAPFKGVAPNASVLVGVELRGRDLSLETNSKIELTMMAADSKGKTYGGRTDSLTMNLRPETRARVEQSGVRVLNRMDLPPGRYQLRVAARDTVKTTVGSVVYDLEVPDFYKDPISLSGLTLTSLGAPAMMIGKPDDDLKAVLPAPPVALRAFARNDEIALFAEVYDRSSDAPHKVAITTSVITDAGGVVYKSEDVRDSSELQGAKGGYGYTARIPLTDIPPGRYVLSVDAVSRVGKNPSVTRQIQIEILAAVPRGPA